MFATTYYRTLRCIFSIGCHNNPHQTGQTVRIRGRDLKWSSYPSRFQPVGSVDRLEYNNNLCIESNENCQTLCVRGRHTQILARPPQIPMVERKVLLQNYHFFRIHVSFPESRFFGLLVGLINIYIYIYDRSLQDCSKTSPNLQRLCIVTNYRLDAPGSGSLPKRQLIVLKDSSSLLIVKTTVCQLRDISSSRNKN